MLSPGASGIVAVVLAVLVLMGNSLMYNATVTLFGQYPGGSSDWGYIWASLLALLVPALASAFLAHRAITAVGVAGWELVLGRAALVLAVIAAAYAVLLTIGMIIPAGLSVTRRHGLLGPILTTCGVTGSGPIGVGGR